jgi:hypothetical protein
MELGLGRPQMLLAARFQTLHFLIFVGDDSTVIADCSFGIGET